MQSHNPTLPIHTTATLPATTQPHSPTKSHPSSTHSSPSHHQPATNISSSSRQQNTTSLASGRTLPIDNTQGEACSSFADLDPPPVYEMSAEGQLTPSSPSSTQNLPTSSAHIEPASSLPSGTISSVHTSDSLPPSDRHTETTQTQPPRRSMRVRRQNPKDSSGPPLGAVLKGCPLATRVAVSGLGSPSWRSRFIFGLFFRVQAVRPLFAFLFDGSHQWPRFVLASVVCVDYSNDLSCLEKLVGYARVTTFKACSSFP
nr:hypothetical protein Iba_chr03aCG6980 [Ipomoea batatas]